MAQKKSILIKLVSTENTGYFYVRKKGIKKPKLSFRKYDPVSRKHIIFKEKKL